MITIKRTDGSVIEEVDAKSVKEAVEILVRKNKDLIRADLQGVNLQHANLQHANLQHANILGAYLPCANLQGANLQGANLQHANLLGANLRHSNLQDANFQGANLRGANFLCAKHSGLWIGSGLRYSLFIHRDIVQVGCCSFTLEDAKALTQEKLDEIGYAEDAELLPMLHAQIAFFEKYINNKG